MSSNRRYIERDIESFDYLVAKLYTGETKLIPVISTEDLFILRWQYENDTRVRFFWFMTEDEVDSIDMSVIEIPEEDVVYGGHVL
jgi:hypothetical protein